MDGWSDAEWLALQLGPVWVASAVVGRGVLDELEQEAFWRAVDDASQDSAVAQQLARSMTANHDWLLEEFQLDSRPVASGLDTVASLLGRMPPEDCRDARAFMLLVGSRLARARGPFGQRIGDQDALTLQLVAQLLETARETSGDNPLNSVLPI